MFSALGGGLYRKLKEPTKWKNFVGFFWKCAKIDKGEENNWYGRIYGKWDKSLEDRDNGENDIGNRGGNYGKSGNREIEERGKVNSDIGENKLRNHKCELSQRTGKYSKAVRKA